ncbi:hypothetical protein RKLH11_2636 [Rhodobacteraceae bacterium KLH11]|nr:hypothetical protein RKLH11_2636 [Rhodobacteraceae bacterium KLH11]
MNLHAAHAFLLRDQQNWQQPHLSWLPKALYRYSGLPNAMRRRK